MFCCNDPKLFANKERCYKNLINISQKCCLSLQLTFLSPAVLSMKCENCTRETFQRNALKFRETQSWSKVTFFYKMRKVDRTSEIATKFFKGVGVRNFHRLERNVLRLSFNREPLIDKGMWT